MPFKIESERFKVHKSAPKKPGFSYERYIDINKGFETELWSEYASSFDSVEKAEKAARSYCERTGREVAIFDPEGGLLATVLRDALDRIWTQVTQEGGAFI